jgi:hypothetical protein
MKRMKKVMLLMGFMAFVFFTHATELRSSEAINNIQSESLVKNDGAVNASTEGRDFQCTVTQKGSVTVYFVTYEISCSSTSSTCKEASAEAFSCVQAGLAQIRQIIK